MATKIILRRRGLALVPEHEADIDLIRRIPRGAEVMVEIRQPRNLQHHKLFRALLAKVIEAGAPFQNDDALLFWIKHKLGFVDRMLCPDGTVLEMPKSTNFESMDQTKFRQFFEQAIELICTEVIPGLEVSALVAEIREMLAPTREMESA